ncbi:MAG: DHA1 family multidrug resistance protein-like MFS transporter [Planctomycetota bacterium]|jgi:DHA1 family multidrug resistance protein-like MFS transporter
MVSWKRTYWVVWVANFVTAIGMMSFLPFFPTHLANLGVAEEDLATWTGAIFGAAPLVAAVMTPIWSALGDRYGRRLMTVRAMLAITIFVGSMGFATGPWQLLALRLGQGCFSGFIAPSITLVSVVAPEERQGYIAGSLATAMALGSVFGPLIGGVVIATSGMGQVFFVVSGASFFAACLVWFFAKEQASDRIKVEKGVSALEVLRGSLRDIGDVWRNSSLRNALQMVFWMILGVGATAPLLQLFVEQLGEDRARAGELTGILYSCAAGVNLVAMPIWGRIGDKHGHAVTLRICSTFALVALFLHVVTTNIVMLFAVRILLAVGLAGATPLAYGLAANEFGVQKRGSAMGAVFASRTFAYAISAIVGGFFSQYIGIRGLFLAGSLILLVVLILQARDRRAATTASSKA